MILDKPQFDCAEKMTFKPYSPNVKIVCVIHAQPPVDNVTVLWPRLKTGFHELHANDAEGHYRFLSTPHEVSFHSAFGWILN